MSYGAFVHCRCFQDGKIPKPHFADFIKYDDDDLSLYLPESIKNNKEKSQKIEEDFYNNWLENGCEHKRMCLIGEWLTNASGMNQFRQFIENHHNNFPILHNYLPQVNGGIVPAEFAQGLLQELISIQNSTETHKKIILKSTKCNEIIYDTPIDTEAIFIITPPPTHYFYIGNCGFFIVNDNDEIVFESRHFVQEKLNEHQFLFTDIKTEKTFNCPYGIDIDDDKDEFFFIQEPYVISENFDYIVTPLIKVAKASIETGNPIHWY